MSNETYDPKELMVVMGPVLISGWAPESMVNIEYDSPRFTVQVGADGESIWSKSYINTATITITLMPNADSNVGLFALHAADLASNKGLVEFALKSTATGKHFAGLARIVETPGQDFQVEAQPTTWVIKASDLKPVLTQSPGPIL